MRLIFRQVRIQLLIQFVTKSSVETSVRNNSEAAWRHSSAGIGAPITTGYANAYGSATTDPADAIGQRQLVRKISGNRSAVAGLGEDEFGDGSHRRALVHRGTLNPPERVGFGQSVLGHQHALGTLNQLARLQPIL